MTHAEAARNYAQILGCLALLDRHIPDDEKREAAKALGLWSWLPEPQQERIELRPEG